MRANALFGALSDVEHCVLHAVLDQLSAGVALLDCRLKVQFANKAFRAMASDGALVLRGESLSSSSLQCARKLDRLTRSVLGGGHGGTIAIPHPDDERLITVLIKPVPGRDGFADRHRHCGAVILFMFDPARPSAPPPECIMDAYQLTMAEAQVALQASTGRSVSEIGSRLAVSPNTVKTHLRRIFAKTRVRGRAGLVGLIATLGFVRHET